MPPRPLPPWTDASEGPVIIGILTATATTTGRQAARGAKALCAAGAAGVQITPEPGLDPAAARCSPAELVASVAEEHLPVGLTVASTVAAHLAVGAGAAWLHVRAGELSSDVAATLAGMGRPCIVGGVVGGAVARPGSPTEATSDLPGRVEAALRHPDLREFPPEALLFEVPADALGATAHAGGTAHAAPAGDAGAMAHAAPIGDAGATGRATADRRPGGLLVVALPPLATSAAAADQASSAPEQAPSEAARGAHAAAAALAVLVGARVVTTDDPAATRRALHVATAISEAR